jgi:hypothetical protein
MLSRHSTPRHVHRGAEVMAVAVPTPRDASVRRRPTPRVNVGQGSAPTTHSRTPLKTTRGEVVPSA